MPLSDSSSAKLAAASSPNFFHDGSDLSSFDQGKIAFERKETPIASGIGLWAIVNASIVSHILALNNQRFEKWHEQPVNVNSVSSAEKKTQHDDNDDNDDIPMT